MHQLAIIVAAVTPTEMLIDRLKESITQWEIHKDEERLKEVAFNSHLIMIKHMTGGEMKGAMEVMGDIDKLDQYRRMFDNKQS